MEHYYRTRRCFKRGSAMLAVLLIVMVVTIVATGFIWKSDVELACGQNLLGRTTVDMLAKSGLEHARGLILNPQDIATEYWTGQTSLQLDELSNDYYDVEVVKTSENNYDVTSTAYRQIDSQQKYRSSITGELRLDPCIALRTGSQWTSEPLTTVYGDVYCGYRLLGSATIYGDAYANRYVASTVNHQGAEYEYVSSSLFPAPGISVTDYSSVYYSDGSVYSVVVSDVNSISSIMFNPSAGNPGGIRYYTGDLELAGNMIINGGLVVNGDLTISGSGNVITAVKNYPALIVKGDLIFDTGGKLEVNGYAQIGGRVYVSTAASGVNFEVLGSLYIINGNIDGAEENSATITVTASADKAALDIWNSSGTRRRWSCAWGAFYRSVVRQ